MSRIDAFLDQVAQWAVAAPDVHGVVLIGSQARTDIPADEWSDVDLLFFVDDVDARAWSTDWLNDFGTPELTFIQRTIDQNIERRVLFADGVEVDMVLLRRDALDFLRTEPVAQGVLARGYRVLYDGDGDGAVFEVEPPPPEPALDVDHVANDFWYHALWTAKKLRRGEAVQALAAYDCHLKRLLLALAREHARRAGVDTWHGERFVETWADPRALAAIWTQASAPEELPAALWHLCDAFDDLAGELAVLPAGAAAARARLEHLVGQG